MLIGDIDPIEGLVVTGWALDPRRPDTPLSLDVLVDRIAVGRVDANECRDAPATGQDHGFRWLIPEDFLDGLLHTVSLCVTNDPSRILDQAQEFRLDADHLPADLLNGIIMRSVALAQLRIAEMFLLSEAGLPSPPALISDVDWLLSKLERDST